MSRVRTRHPWSAHPGSSGISQIAPVAGRTSSASASGRIVPIAIPGLGVAFTAVRGLRRPALIAEQVAEVEPFAEAEPDAEAA